MTLSSDPLRDFRKLAGRVRVVRLDFVRFMYASKLESTCILKVFGERNNFYGWIIVSTSRFDALEKAIGVGGGERGDDFDDVFVPAYLKGIVNLEHAGFVVLRI